MSDRWTAHALDCPYYFDVFERAGKPCTCHDEARIRARMSEKPAPLASTERNEGEGR